MMPPTLAPLDRHEIPLEKPLPFPVFDQNGTLLFGEGHVIADERELDTLLEIGLFHHPQWPASSLQSQTSPSSHGFDQTGLTAGAILFARKQAGTSPAFMPVKLIDSKKDGELEFCFCKEPGEEEAFRTGDWLEIKAIRGLHIIAFTSQVCRFIPRQPAHFRLDPPATITHRVLRKNLRSNVSLPVSTCCRNGIMCHDGLLGNLSACGGLLELNQLIASPGSEILLTLPLPANGSEYLLELHARVRNLQTSENNHIPVVQYGLEFIGITADDQLLLEQYVFYSLQEQTL